MTDYKIHTNIRFGPLDFIDVQQIVDETQDDWFNQTLCRVNDSVVRLGILKGEFHWHTHDDEDELFYVIDGTLLIDLEEGRTVTLEARQGMMVPKGALHRTRAPGRVIVLMVEKYTVVPIGDR
jgi:mannose-6-phosphate isomerase-like protein (cupin superfamily)